MSKLKISDIEKALAFNCSHYLIKAVDGLEFEDAYGLALLIFHFGGGPVRPNKETNLARAKKLSSLGLVQIEKSMNVIATEFPVGLKDYYSGKYMKYGISYTVDWEHRGTWWISPAKLAIDLADKFIVAKK